MRFVFHLTPTHASWLKQVECWLAILSRTVVRRRTHASREDLPGSLGYIEYRNGHGHPFYWVHDEKLIHDS